MKKILKSASINYLSIDDQIYNSFYQLTWPSILSGIVTRKLILQMNSNSNFVLLLFCSSFFAEWTCETIYCRCKMFICEVNLRIAISTANLWPYFCLYVGNGCITTAVAAGCVDYNCTNSVWCCLLKFHEPCILPFVWMWIKAKYLYKTSYFIWSIWK